MKSTFTNCQANKNEKNVKWKSLKKESPDDMEGNLLQSVINMAELRGYHYT